MVNRFRRDFPPSRSDGADGIAAAAASKRGGGNPPSRHLWVGNLPRGIMEPELAEQFLRFGELESLAYRPGRSYAFVNYKDEEDAIAAFQSLQGSPLAGNPLRIEFAKAEKAITQPQDEEYSQHRDERSMLRESPFSHKDSKIGSASPDPLHPDKSKTSDKSAEPSEVLWIGFPALLKVDEMILRKAFSPFGEIEKITVFPGRSYAFVRFRSIMSASRAKETLQGKLFGNPRVHICFAKSEPGTSNSGRIPLSPHFMSNMHPVASDHFPSDRDFGSLIADPKTRSHFTDPGDFDLYGVNRKGSLYPGGSNAVDNWRFGEELGPPPELYEHHGSPARERGDHMHHLALGYPRKGQMYDEQWDMPEDSYLFHGAKKLRTDSFPPDRELPDYPFSDQGMEKRSFPRTHSDFPQSEMFDNNFEARHFGYKPIEQRPINFSLPRDGSSHWKESYDFQTGSDSLPSYPVERRRFTPEPEKPSLNLWKWEGTIAKGGTPVCRARCFPVGKVMDTMLPEFLDCTARTGLDMLAKHYFQAASAWVVFFSPAGDGDIGYYNEFLHYLGEKQRAAVAKLDDKNTLFLVPPSDFSKKVLKVPGELSISGVVLRLEPSVSKSPTPSRQFPSKSSFPDSGKSGSDLPFFNTGTTDAAFAGSSCSVASISDLYNEDGYHYHSQQRNPVSLSIVSGNRNKPPQGSAFVGPGLQEHHSVIPRPVQEQNSSHYASGMSSNPSSGNSKLTLQETNSTAPSSLPIAGLQPQQLAQLASSLLGQQKRPGSNPNWTSGIDISQASTTNQSENQLRTAQTNSLQNDQVSSEISTSQLGQFQRLQQQQTHNVPATAPPPVQRELQPG
ncbi:hypothetical protein Tsubulata_040365, partial [Turnera subulata]